VRSLGAAFHPEGVTIMDALLHAVSPDGPDRLTWPKIWPDTLFGGNRLVVRYSVV